MLALRTLGGRGSVPLARVGYSLTFPIPLASSSTKASGAILPV